jgi:hypothetical protein
MISNFDISDENNITLDECETIVENNNNHSPFCMISKNNSLLNPEILNLFNSTDNIDIPQSSEIAYEELYLIKKEQAIDKKNENTFPTSEDKIESNEINYLSKKSKMCNRKSKRKKEHSKFEKDNIMRKLNIHFISFMVKYVNFNIQKLISKNHPLFINLSYEFKKKLNNSTFAELKNMNLGEILRNEGSWKNKRNLIYESDYNERIFKSVYKTSLKDLLDTNYIKFYREVYASSSFIDKKYLDIYVAPKNILFFNDFLEKEIQKNKLDGELYKKRLIYLSKKEFVKEGFPFFATKNFIKKNK